MKIERDFKDEERIKVLRSMIHKLVRRADDLSHAVTERSRARIPYIREEIAHAEAELQQLLDSPSDGD